MKSRIISLLLVFAMLLCIAPAVFAADDEAVTAANALYDLGLFKGTGTDASGNPKFDLDRAPTRHEAVTMLVRLLGKEDEAQAGTWDIPFTDVAAWAKPYVGYAYANGLTNGTGATTFSGDATVTATQYITLVLRALGYDSTTDFEWNKAWELSDKIEMTDGRYNAGTKQFNRGDVAIISHSALNMRPKNSTETLLSTLGLTPAKNVQLTESYRGVPAYYEISGKMYYGGIESTLRLYEYDGEQYAEINPTFYMKTESDTRVEGALISLLAISNNLFEVQTNDNPYTDGDIRLDLRPYQSINMTITERRNYTSISEYDTAYQYEYKGKMLSTPTFSENFDVIDGVRFIKDFGSTYFVNVNDFLAYFGINKKIGLGKNGNINYIVVQ